MLGWYFTLSRGNTCLCGFDFVNNLTPWHKEAILLKCGSIQRPRGLHFSSPQHHSYTQVSKHTTKTCTHPLFPASPQPPFLCSSSSVFTLVLTLTSSPFVFILFVCTCFPYDHWRMIAWAVNLSHTRFHLSFLFPRLLRISAKIYGDLFITCTCLSLSVYFSSPMNTNGSQT